MILPRVSLSVCTTTDRHSVSINASALPFLRPCLQPCCHDSMIIATSAPVRTVESSCSLEAAPLTYTCVLQLGGVGYMDNCIQTHKCTLVDPC